MKYNKLFRREMEMDLSKEMAYKGNFIVKLSALLVADIIGPLLAIMIYSASSGIPGWSLEDFLLFQATLIVVFGFGHAFVTDFPWIVINTVREGEFDRFLVKPYNTLLLILAQSATLEGFAEMILGIVIAVVMFIKLGITVISLNTVYYILLVCSGFVVQLAIAILTGALAFLVVKSEGLAHLFIKLSDFARYPLVVYGPELRMFLTFFFPIAVSAFYPVDALLNGINALGFIGIVAPVVFFLFISIALWNHAMKSYASAGG